MHDDKQNCISNVNVAEKYVWKLLFSHVATTAQTKRRDSENSVINFIVKY